MKTATRWVLPWPDELYQYQRKTVPLSGSDKDGNMLVKGIVHLSNLVDWGCLADVQSTLLSSAYRLEAC